MIKNIVVIVLLFTSVAFMAQRSNSSPYSYFGIGDEFSINTVEQSSMGGIGVAFSHYKYLNFTNPAAYGNLKYTTYAFGLLSNDLTIKTNDVKQTSNSTSLSYVALAFPIGKKAGFSFGMQPISTVGYSLTNTTFDDDGVTPIEISLFEGNGGVNRFYGSFGINVYKGLSVGIEADYSFGSLENGITNQIDGVDLLTKHKEFTKLRGGSIKLGAQYEHKLKNNLIVNAGATLKLGNNLNATGESLTYTLTGTGLVRDTLVDQNGDKLINIDGKFKFPVKSTLGIGVGEFDKWYAGLEYENQNAISTSDLATITSGAFRYGNANRISFGGFYLPNINSISSYWKRITYRAGLRIENTGLLVNGSTTGSNFTKINDFGISFGVGIPMKRMSTVNMGFEFGKRGTIENNLIQENYFNFRLSLSLTDNWFIKRKID